MNIIHYFRHIDSSEALKSAVEQRAAALKPLIIESLPIHVTFTVEGVEHTVHIGLHARNNTQVEVEETSDDMYKSLDMAFDSLTRVVTREKEKQTHHHVKVDPFAKTEAAAARVSDDINYADSIDASKVLESYAATGH